MTNEYDFESVKNLATMFVSWNSENGTPAEAEFSTKLHNFLSETEYFRANPGDLLLIDSHGSPMTHSVVAVVRGKGKKALALAGHFDTVSIDNYHDIKHLACNANELRDALILSLSRNSLSEQEQLALTDLQSGDYLPGRGMLDMKSGIAAGIACLMRFAENDQRVGNLMLVVTPDEERESRGMRTVRDALPKVARQLDLEIVGGINMDVTSDQGDGTEGRCVYRGTIGKLLPFALVIGCSSHGSYPFEGVSAQAMVAGILSRIEGNASLAVRDELDISPPPICLEAKDLRNAYELTTPERSWLSFNWLFHGITVEQALARFRDEVTTGAQEAIIRFSGQAKIYSDMLGKAAGPMPQTPDVISFDELRRLAERRVGDRFQSQYSELEMRLSSQNDPLAESRKITEWLVDMAAISGPAIVVGIAGLHYPSTHLDLDSRGDRILHDAIESAMADFSHDPQTTMIWREHFQGVCDMSFFGHASLSTDIVAENTPVSRLVDRPPHDSLQFPVVNIGPWGREFHQRLERVHATYAFEVLPKFISMIADRFLRAVHWICSNQ